LLDGLTFFKYVSGYVPGSTHRKSQVSVEAVVMYPLVDKDTGLYSFKGII
jgi:hypothetical protein